MVTCKCAAGRMVALSVVDGCCPIFRNSASYGRMIESSRCRVVLNGISVEGLMIDADHADNECISPRACSRGTCSFDN